MSMKTKIIDTFRIYVDIFIVYRHIRYRAGMAFVFSP